MKSRLLSAAIILMASIMVAPPANADGLTAGQAVRYEGIVCAQEEDAKALLNHLTLQGEMVDFRRPPLCLAGEVSFTPEKSIAKAAALDTGTIWQVVKVYLLNMGMFGYIITALPFHTGQPV